MFYTPVGDMFLLQALHGEEHALLPRGPGLYKLEGEGTFEKLVARLDGTGGGGGEADEECWLDRRGGEAAGGGSGAGAGAAAAAGAWGEWDVSPDGDVWDGGGGGGDEVGTGTGKTAGARAGTGSGTAGGGGGGGGDLGSGKDAAGGSAGGRMGTRMNRLACLTQSDAALTGSLLIGRMDGAEREALLGPGGWAALRHEFGRDAAQRVLLNTPHPLTVLSGRASHSSTSQLIVSTFAGYAGYDQ